MNKNVIYAALMFVVTMSSGNASAQQLPYQNPALSAHERAVDLCGRLTLEEKASLMLDDSPSYPAIGNQEIPVVERGTAWCGEHGRCNRLSGTYRNGSFV